MSLNTAAYGLMLACGDHEAGPFLMNVSRVEKNLKISAQVVATMAALQAEEPLSFADGDIMAHRSTYELLRTLLDLDALVLVGESGAGLTVVKLSDEGLRGARLSGADPEDMVLMIDVIERGLPLGEIEYYEEGLWHQSSDKSYLAEIIVMSVGGASALTGVVFLALASSQSDVVDECRETGACDDANAQENLDYYATDLFVGEVLLGVGATMVFCGRHGDVDQDAIGRRRERELGGNRSWPLVKTRLMAPGHGVGNEEAMDCLGHGIGGCAVVVDGLQHAAGMRWR